jgi:hypothetical protein
VGVEVCSLQEVAAEEVWRQRPQGVGHSVAGRRGGVVVRQVQQQHKPGRELGERPDRGAVLRLVDEITLRLPCLDLIGGLRRALVDHLHVARTSAAGEPGTRCGRRRRRRVRRYEEIPGERRPRKSGIVRDTPGSMTLLDGRGSGGDRGICGTVAAVMEAMEANGRREAVQ